MASKKHDLSTEITPNTWEDVPLSPLAPRAHPNVGQAAASGAPVSSTATKWKLKHPLLDTEHVTVKDAHGHAVQEIKITGIVKRKLALSDLQTGEILATCKSNSSRKKAKLYFFDDEVYARLEAKGVDHRRWEIVTPTGVFHIKPSAIFGNDFDVFLDMNVVASVKSKIRSTYIDIHAGQDIPFLITCLAFIDYVSR